MSLSKMSNFIKQKSSLGPTNGRQTVGDGATLSFDTEPSVLAVCHLQGNDDMYYYSTTFSGGPGVRPSSLSSYQSPHIPALSGGFDVPKPKCPPDRGSSDCVTGSPASISNSPYFSNYYPPSVHSNPRPIPPSRSASSGTSPDLATPPLTPDIGSDGRPSPAVSDKNQKDALDFLMTVFPHHGVGALAYSRSVAISAPNLGAAFDGVVLQLPGKPKTLYVDGKSAQSVSIRESIVALLDLADESLECSALVIVLERSSPSLGKILHSLMYVGGTVVTKPPFQVDPAFVLVGLDI
ncbi:ornithine decarboxylase antizyme-domain-containing protein [Mycena maculata]|uniref:Ornithine decarboxylase antizyme n=1 Tax=Mycena maculata TaxID=230809 RepID=A0AAD7I2S3_9AGAR|nr:ornithine decarboxylase antizyme-domain-containing protein [Mycena maculata]